MASQNVKAAIYLSGIALATTGYIFNRQKQGGLSRNKILYQVYYPLLLQYSATLDLYYCLISKNQRKSMSYKLCIGTSLVSAIIIPYIHSKIYFSNPEKYSTRRIITQLFKPSNQCVLNNMQFYTFFALLSSQIYSYYISRKNNNSKLSFETSLFYYISPAIIGSFIFKKCMHKIKEMMNIYSYNPPLIYHEMGTIYPQHNYAMHMLYDIDQSVLTPELASICMQYTTGNGLMTVKEANKALADIIYECYNDIITRSIQYGVSSNAMNDTKTPKVLYEMLESEDTRFVDQLCEVLYKCKFKDNDKLELSKMWIKNKLAALYDTSLIYESILYLTTKSWNWTDIKALVSS